ncbi:MAG: hypothetical protein HC852_04555 [Acaryochloridaceae cyanobacterium RU_4_10]|nr:hypothetical protein [Acaryochloridaceae cyanobacterium RU_4_10]
MERLSFLALTHLRLAKIECLKTYPIAYNPNPRTAIAPHNPQCDALQ